MSATKKANRSSLSEDAEDVESADENKHLKNILKGLQEPLVSV